MSINDTNLEIKNYNGDVVSIIIDENKSITDTKNIAQIFDKKCNKLDTYYKKVLSEVPGKTLFDKNGNVLD